MQHLLDFLNSTRTSFQILFLQYIQKTVFLDQEKTQIPILYDISHGYRRLFYSVGHPENETDITQLL